MRYPLKDLKPVSPSVTYKAERKRVRNKWSVVTAAKECKVSRAVWYNAMAGKRVTTATRARFATFVELA